MKQIRCNLIYALLISALIGCHSPPIPRQKGYFKITLPNQDKKKYNQPVTSMQIAQDISKKFSI